jgi:predicted  nucleic acid-binding Zn-ribbon protein
LLLQKSPHKKQQRLNKKKQEAEDKKKKDAEKKVVTERKLAESKPKCVALMDEIKEKGHDHVNKLTVGQLKMLPQYKFNSTTTSANKKDDCDAAVPVWVKASDSLT